jgi:hypothetical protein
MSDDSEDPQWPSIDGLDHATVYLVGVRYLAGEADPCDIDAIRHDLAMNGMSIHMSTATKHGRVHVYALLSEPMTLDDLCAKLHGGKHCALANMQVVGNA